MRSIARCGVVGAFLWSALVLVSATSASGATYWVSPSGDDDNDGLSLANAWETLQHAADEVGPGDTVRVQDGDYAGFYLETSGTAAQPITFLAESPNVEITEDNDTTPDGINLEGASHVVIDGFTVNGRTRAGVRAVLAEFVTVRNCHLGHNGRWGILTGFVDDFLAEDNVAHHSIDEHGIYVSNSSDRPIVRRNVVYSNHGNGLHFNGDAEIPGGDGLIENALVEENVIFENAANGGGGSGINMDGGVNGIIRNNLLFNNHASGISLYRIDGAAGASGNLVVNNTIVNAADGRWCLNINNGSTGNVVRNNVFYSYHSFRGAIAIDSSSRPGFVSNDNIVSNRFSTNGGSTVITLAQWQALGYDASSFLSTPAALFVDPGAGNDYHLREDSPAIDAGASTGAPDVDLDGNERPLGAGFDVGAYEYTLVACGDGDADPGEECGEPGLSCGPGSSCSGCTCSNAPACASGVPLERPLVKLFESDGRLTLKGEAVIPKPWSGVDPAANGIRVVIDVPFGSDGLDVAIPGGSSWLVGTDGKRWKYVDTSPSDGITQAIVRDLSAKENGLLRFTVKMKDADLTLPDPEAVRTYVRLGDADECAAIEWNAPGELPPRCTSKPGRVDCR